MKETVFLIITTLLTVGIVLPGCSATPSPEEHVIKIAVCGPMTDLIGQNHWDGASLAADEINGAGGVAINGTKYTIELVKVETKEATEGEDGGTGMANLQAVIDNVDFVVGGFRTEIVSVYREVAMNARKMFMDCGAALGALQFWVVPDYDKYKYWFKVSPYNEVFSVKSLLKMTETIGTVLKQKLEEQREAVAEDYRVPEDGKLRMTILAEDTPWSWWVMVAAQHYLPLLGYTVTGTTLVHPTASNITWELSAIAASKPHIIVTAFWGPVADVYSTQKTELGIPAITIGINVPGQEKKHWANTGGNCNGEIMLDTWAEGLQNTAKTTAFFNAFIAKTGEYPIDTAATYDAIHWLKEAIEAISVVHVWDDIADVIAPDNIDALIQYLETSSYTATGGTIAYYPMPAITLNATSADKPGLYALSETQVKALYDLTSYNKTYNQADWMCGFASGLLQPHIAHDLVYGPGYATGIGSQWQDGHKVGVWPMDLGDEYDAALTNQYGNWNFQYPGTKPMLIPIQGFLAG